MSGPPGHRLAGITPFPYKHLESSIPSQPCLGWPQYLAARETAVRQGSGEPPCRGRTRRDSGLWGLLWLGRGVNSWLPDPTSESRPHPAAPGLQEHLQSSQITGPGCRPPGSWPLQVAHRQTALKIDLGWPSSGWVSTVGVDEECAMGGSPPHTLPCPRLGTEASLR